MSGRNIESASNTFTLLRASEGIELRTLVGYHPRYTEPRRVTSMITLKIVFCWAVIASSAVLWEGGLCPRTRSLTGVRAVKPQWRDVN